MVCDVIQHGPGHKMRVEWAGQIKGIIWASVSHPQKYRFPIDRAQYEPHAVYPGCPQFAHHFLKWLPPNIRQCTNQMTDEVELREVHVRK